MVVSKDDRKQTREWALCLLYLEGINPRDVFFYNTELTPNQ